MNIPVITTQSSVISQSLVLICVGLGAIMGIIFIFSILTKGLTKITLITLFITFLCGSYVFLVSAPSYGADNQKLEKEIIKTYKAAKAEAIQSENWRTILPPGSVGLYQITTEKGEVGNCFVMLEKENKLQDSNNTGTLQCGTMNVEKREEEKSNS